MRAWGSFEWLQVANICGTMIAALIGAAAVRIGRNNHDLMNSRLTELLNLTRTASKAEGVKEGRENSP